MSEETKSVEKPVPELGEKILDFDLNSVEQEILQGFRIIELGKFRGKDNVKVKLLTPSVQVDAECSRVYAETYNELLLSDKKMLTKEEMEDQLKKRGIWTEKHDTEIEVLDDRMENVMRAGQDMHYKKKVSKRKLTELKKELKKIQDQKSTLLARKQSLLSQTIESLSELASLEHKIYLCCSDLDGKPLWDEEEDFRKEFNRYALSKLLQEGIIFWSGLPQNVLDLLPEEILRGAASERSQEVPSGEPVSQ